ncbi:MAG: hypothetical protein J0H50_10060 [Xanthomonadales bacterium]|nr:hypothetical protein [Xanthomonadales bacterium]
MYKTLMVHLELDAEHGPLLAVAADLAERFDADVVGIVACQLVPLVVGHGMVPVQVFESDRTEIEAQMGQAEQVFRAALAKRAGRVHWLGLLTAGPPTDAVVEQMRGADLLITAIDAQAGWPGPGRRVDVEDLVMRLGRPALVVPARAHSLVPERILVGWKDTRETRGAVTDALPLLRLAKQVVVAEVVTQETQLPAARTHTGEVCTWLQRHGVVAEPLALATGDQYVVSLDAIAEQVGADLIVAGAYGHSRMREWALGGVTRDLLKYSRRCSLLSH